MDVRTGILTREGALLLDSIRGAVGGDAATVTPVEPLGALTPLAAAFTPVDGLGPVTAAQMGQDSLSPIAGATIADGGMSPVCGCDMAGGLDPVSPIGPETLP